jgi:hypothetical protein
MDKILGPFPQEITTAVNNHRRPKHRPKGGWFHSDGRLRWPEIAPDEKSIQHVERQCKLEHLFHLKDPKQRLFHDFLKDMLIYNPCDRKTAKYIFCQQFSTKNTKQQFLTIVAFQNKFAH